MAAQQEKVVLHSDMLHMQQLSKNGCQALFDHPTLTEMSQEIEKLILAKLENIDSEQSKILPAQPGGGQS